MEGMNMEARLKLRIDLLDLEKLARENQVVFKAIKEAGAESSTTPQNMALMVERMFAHMETEIRKIIEKIEHGIHDEEVVDADVTSDLQTR